MKCTEGCQVFLWGGTGSPRIDDDGDCYCVCEGEWSTHNILGARSCVPSGAHFVFGAVGLLTALAILCQAAYQLNRQVKYHRCYLASSTSPVEKCRRQLHVVVIVHAVLNLCYFTMVLALEGHQLWAAVVLMSGLTQFTTNIGGMLTLRMWIYTNDPRLMQDTPEILTISHALERPAGQRATHCTVCIGAVAGTMLSAARHSQTATKVACVAFVCMCVVVELAVFKCGMSLLRTINRSVLHRSSAVSRTSTTTTETGTGDREARGRVDDLATAKRKVVVATSSCLGLGGATIAILTFSVSSPLGMFAPLLFFAIPMGLAPLIWFGMNIQLHAGRSKRRTTPGSTSGATSKPKYPRWKDIPRAGFAGTFPHSPQIAPTEAPTSP